MDDSWRQAAMIASEIHRVALGFGEGDDKDPPPDELFMPPHREAVQKLNKRRRLSSEEEIARIRRG